MAKNNATESAPLPVFDAANFQIPAGFESQTHELIKLNIGQGIQGRLAKVTSYDAVDKQTGEVRSVPMFLIDTGAAGKYWIGGVTEIANALDGFKEGTNVILMRKPNQGTNNGNEMHRYSVYTKR